MRWFFVLLLLASPAYAGQGMYPVPMVYQGGGGGGGATLVGNPADTANTEFTLSADYLLVLSQDAVTWEQGYTAVASGTVAKGYSRLKYVSAGSNCKMVVASNAGAVLGVSAAKDIQAVATLSDVEFIFSAGPSIVSGTKYYIGTVCNGDVNIGHDGTSWSAGADVNSYTSPAAFNPATDLNGSSALGYPKMWVTD